MQPSDGCFQVIYPCQFNSWFHSCGGVKVLLGQGWYSCYVYIYMQQV